MICLMATYSCEKNFLDKASIGTVNEATLATKTGVQGLLIGAYSLLDGWDGIGAKAYSFYTGVSNWIYGGVAADDAHFGTLVIYLLVKYLKPTIMMLLVKL